MKTNLKKVVGIILLAIVLLTAISALIQLRRDKSMQQDVADTHRALREQGFKTELADFNVTTDPAMQTRMAALTVFENFLELGANDDQLDFLPRAADGTATVIWKQDSLPLEHGLVKWSDLHAALDTNREALDAACAAAVSGPIRFDVDFSDFGNHSAHHFSALRHLSLNLSDRVILELHEGHFDAAWTNLLSATRLATAWEPEPPGLSHLIHSILAEVAFQNGWQALQNRNWSDAKLFVLQQEWESANFFTNIPEMIAMERVDLVDHCRKLAEQTAFTGFSCSRIVREATQHPSDAFSEIKGELNIMRYRGSEALSDEKALMLGFRDLELEARKAVESPTWAGMRVQPGVTNAIAFNSISGDLMFSVTTDQRVNCLVFAFAAQAEAQRQIIITAIALERYHGKYGAYPAALASLAPEFLKAVPVDFMDGQPLRYRLTENGQFVLYSVGLDCVDDGGKMLSPDAPRMPKDKNGNPIVQTNVDIVWPRPVNP